VSLLDAVDWPLYRAWLVDQYGLATARKGTGDLRSLVRHPELAQNPSSRQRAKDYLWAWETWLWYVSETGTPNPLPPELRPPPVPPLDGRRRRRTADKEPELAFDVAGYRRLRELVRVDEHQTAPALDVIVSTGLRVQDVLRTPASALRAGLADPDGRILVRVKGGKVRVSLVRAAPDAWRRLGRWVDLRGAPNVAAACTRMDEGCENPDADGAAYRSCDRSFKRLAAAAGCGGRLHLHRARRTIAVYARKFASAGDVQEVLSHQHGSTTRIYTGMEAGAEVAADVLERLNAQLDRA
jgi:integrase